MKKTNLPEKATLKAGHSRFGETFSFLKAFIRNPAQVGSVTPSSHYLAEAMVEPSEFETAKTVVELGCGTGPITRAILNRISKKTKYIGVELDKACYDHLKEVFPGVCFHNDSAENIREILAQHHLTQTDIVISGLPWAVMPTALQDKIFEQIAGNLTPDGVFITFAYIHAKKMKQARRLRQRLKQDYETVELSRTIWRNFPPAFFYYCKTPKIKRNE